MDDLTPPIIIIPREYKHSWGSINLESKANVTLHVGACSAKPIPISLTHQWVLGRSEEHNQEAYLNLAAYGATEKGVSHQHAALETLTNNVMLTDLSSTNGTFLNGEQLPPNQPYLVRSGDEIRLGQLVIYIYYEKARVPVSADPQPTP